MLALPAAGSAAPPEPPAEPPLPQLGFEPGSYDFGLQQVNSSNQATLQLRNDGEAAAPVYSLEIVGPGSSVYWIDGGGTSCYGATLQPNESCSIRVDFNPYDAVQFNAQLRAGSEQATSFTASLSGEGGRAAIGPVLDPTNFGAAVVGSAGVTKTIDVVNSGNYPGGAFIAVIAGGAIGSFHLLDENCTGIRLTPGAGCTLLVDFQPLSSGVKTARLGLFGEGEGPNEVTLSGIGVDAPTEPRIEAPASGVAAQPHPHHRRRAGKFGRRKTLRWQRNGRSLIRPVAR